MAADRLRIIVDEILVSIKQTFDDKDITQAQVAFWTIIVGNKLLSQHNAKRDSGAFLSIFTNVPILSVSANSNPNVIANRKHIELPGAIFDYDMDKGIEYIAYYNENEQCDPELNKKTIQRTSPAELQWLSLNAYTKPSPKNPYWYRAGDYVYLVGIESVPIKNVEIGLYLTISPLEKIDIDKPFPFPQELMDVLKRQVVDLARFSYLFPGDNGNDGSNSSDQSQKQIPKIVSVNETQQSQ